LWPVTDGQYPNHLPISHDLTLTLPAVHLHPNDNPDSSSSPVPALGKAYACPFCAELGIHAGANRISDLKRHLKNFHNMNAEWFCRVPWCEIVFDWQAAYETHLKEAHNGTHLPANEAKVVLRTQVVFACGFIKCKETFEAPNDGDATQTAKDYFDHVAKHIANGASISDWTYSTRIRNLLRQSLVQRPWKESTSKEIRNQLTWQPHNSSVLRKKLECRDVEDVRILVQVAIFLGSLPHSEPNSPQLELPLGFTTPTLDNMVTAWQAQNRAVSVGSAEHASNSSMDSFGAANRLHSSMTTILPHGGHSYASIGQEPYPVSSLRDDPGWPLSGLKPHHLNPQQLAQEPALQHQGLTASQPPAYGSYNLVHGNAVSPPQHPLAQWPGVESLGQFPSQEKVVADIQNRPRTPSKRLFSLAKKSFESMRARKGSASEADCEMTGNTSPMPPASLALHNVTSLQRGNGSSSSSQISLSNSSSQFPDRQTRY
jgi:uncharacterized C2H2 Zn-finger protein